jgi:hypothetical protein
LHEKSVRQSWEQPHRRKRRGEPWETYTERLRAMWTAEKSREAEDDALRRAARYEETGDWRFADEQPAPELPPLHLVTGWSKAIRRRRSTIRRRRCSAGGGWRIEEAAEGLTRLFRPGAERFVQGCLAPIAAFESTSHSANFRPEADVRLQRWTQ